MGGISFFLRFLFAAIVVVGDVVGSDFVRPRSG
jgi:hypothetical protein